MLWKDRSEDLLSEMKYVDNEHIYQMVFKTIQDDAHKKLCKQYESSRKRTHKLVLDIPFIFELPMQRLSYYLEGISLESLGKFRKEYEQLNLNWRAFLWEKGELDNIGEEDRHTLEGFRLDDLTQLQLFRYLSEIQRVMKKSG